MKKVFLWVLPNLFLILLSGCLGTDSSARGVAAISPTEQAPSLPAAAYGNALVAINDEAPVIRNESGEPIRQDRESQAEVVHFEGFNEE